MKRMLFCLSLAMAFIFMGCAGTFPNDQAHEAQAEKSIEKRVKFDLDCQDVSMSLISDVTRLGQQMTSMNIGVKGCGKKASYYVECVSNWGKITCSPRMNSIQTSEETGAPSTGN
ncbi:MAG: hypothetical protein M0P13_11515 [Fibrobacteraceae bacterium]|nr:hypothetical protein [Fibrobacteraceae bacterium]